MKYYGSNKATEFTKKQISCLYGAAKRGELKIEKWMMSDLYNLAEYYGHDDNKSIEEAERKVLPIIDRFFAKDMAGCQELITAFTESRFNCYVKGYREKLERAYI